MRFETGNACSMDIKPGTGFAIARIGARSDTSERVENSSPKATKNARNKLRQRI